MSCLPLILSDPKRRLSGVSRLRQDQWRYDGRFSRHDFRRLLGRQTDDMHHWYHSAGQRIAATADHLIGLQIHDSLVVLEKGRKACPAHIQVGSETGRKPALAGYRTEAEAKP